MTNQEWRRCKRIPAYEISNDGLLRNIRTGRIMKTRIDAKGYEVISLTINGKVKTEKIHRLVAEAFLEDDDYYGEDVTFRDGDRSHNHSDNLRWTSRRDLIRNTYSNGRRQTHRMRRIRCVETGEVFDSIIECSRVMGINRSSICKCVNDGYLKTREGYHFEPVD